MLDEGSGGLMCSCGVGLERLTSKVNLLFQPFVAGVKTNSATFSALSRPGHLPHEPDMHAREVDFPDSQRRVRVPR